MASVFLRPYAFRRKRSKSFVASATAAAVAATAAGRAKSLQRQLSASARNVPRLSAVGLKSRNDKPRPQHEKPNTTARLRPWRNSRRRERRASWSKSLASRCRSP